MKLGTYIKNQRKKIGISQKELAERLGLKEAQLLSNIERGLAQIPLKRISDFSRVLNISEDFILLSIARERLKVILNDSKTDNEKLKFIIDLISKLSDLDNSSLKLIKDLLEKIS